MTLGYQFVKNLILGVCSVSAGLLKDGTPSEMDHVALLPEALLNEGTQRQLLRKTILVLEVDKLLLQVVML